MRTIDVHAHISPEACFEAMRQGKSWHGISPDETFNGHKYNPRTMWTPEQRIDDMDSLGVDVHVLSTGAFFYFYDRDAAQVTAMDRECNDYVSQLTREHPTRFAGLANLPLQDVRASVAELERSVTQLGLKGAMIGDHVNGKTYDDPEFFPLWQVAEQLGAVIFIHQGGSTVVSSRLDRYHLPNTVGNLADRAVTFASFVFGGVMDQYPDLKVCLAHGGGYTCFGAGRMDRGWQVRSEARVNIQKPPSSYLNKFYYDCLTHSEEALRMLIDMVGIDKVVFGTDWPFDMCMDWPVAWLLKMESITQEEKEAILWRNFEKLLGLS
jgi:aminocarboxymuconate-semialdehyde decarboxylase